MTEQATQPQSAEAEAGKAQAAPAADAKPAARTVSDPREVATLVMARMKHVSAKRDELTAAINALVDITGQLTRSYGEQMLAIEQLRRRVKALEAAAAARSSQTTTTVQ